MTVIDAAARDSALDLERHVIAVAPAGSGKTGLLVQRHLAALATVERPEQVVAITFTNKAAAEIRQRLAQLLQRAAAGAAADNEHDAAGLRRAQAVLAQDRRLGWNLLASPERLRALTIDGFNAQIAAELPLLSGLGGRPGIAEDARALHQQALLALFDDALDESAEPVLHEAAAAWLRCAGNRLDRLLPPLAELLARREQWANAVVSDAALAGHDAAVLDALHHDHHQRLADALGADAVALLELARDAAANDDALAWAATLTRWPAPGAANSETLRALAALLVTDKGQLRKPRGVSSRMGFAAKTPATEALKSLLAARDGDQALEEAAAAVRGLPPSEMPAAQAQLREHLRVLLRHALLCLRLTMAARGEVDFTELSLAALQALRPQTDGDDEIYGDALLKRDAEIRHLLVDEMQDTSETQLALVRQLTGGWQPGDGHSLFLVGDPQQSIYAFRKAEVGLFLRIWDSGRLGGLTLTRVRLQTNFRSVPALVAWFNHSFSASFPRADDPYTGEVAYAPAVSPATAAAADDGPAVGLHAFDDSAAEAEAAADGVAQYLAAGERDIAILARARTHLPAVLAALRRRGVAYRCQDIDALAALPAVRDVLACARALWHAEDRLHWAVLLRAPWVGLSWADLLALSAGRQHLSWPQRLQQSGDAALSDDGRARCQRLLAALDAVQADLNRTSLAERVEAMWLRLDGPACVDAGGLADALRALQLLRAHVNAGGFTDLPAFERAVTELYASPAEGAVQVMTVHKAKGLEFDHVLLVGCGRRARGDDKPLLHLVDTPHGALLVPKPPDHWPAEDGEPAQALFDYAHQLHVTVRRNEALRLLYVAATRARRTLDLYLTLKRDRNGEWRPASGSFAAWIWPVIEGVEVTESTSTPHVATSDALTLPPLAPRLPLDYRAPPPDALFVPREVRTLRPSERVLSAREAKREDEDDLYAQLVGTLFHQAMARIADQGVARWHADDDRHARALAAGLRRMGLPEPRVGAAVARVLTLVSRTLDGEHGDWLLKPRRWAASEYALSGYRGGEWVAAVIDRCFEDDDGALWIIDYKASAEALSDTAAEAYVAQCRQRYAGQLRQYAELMAEHRPGPAIRTALYLPELDRLERVQAAA